MEMWQTLVAVVAGLVVILGAVKVWVVPVVVAMVKVAELHPTWVQIGEHYKVNGRPMLHEQIEDLSRKVDGIYDRVDTVEAKIDVFVLQRQKGGRRNGDPK